MSDSKNPPEDDLQQSWIESLLVSLSRCEDHSDLVERAMHQIESARDDQLSQLEPAAFEARRRRLIMWPTFGLAIAIVIAMLIVLPTNSQSAIAAIRRSLDVAADRLPRKYRLQVRHQRSAGTVRIDNELWVCGNDQFALRHPGLLPGTNVWLGQNGDESWVVPPIGPVLKGDKTFLRGYLRSWDEFDTPYLHVSTLLNRMMSQGFRLTKLADEDVSIRDGRTFRCSHVRAEFVGEADQDLPESIELWTSLESGMAVRMVADWPSIEDGSAQKQVVLTFQREEPGLPSQWFTAEEHTERQRPVIISSH